MSADVKDEMDRLRLTQRLVPIIPDFLSDKENFSISFHNCRSLRKHIDDIKKDQNYLAINIIALCETRLRNSEFVNNAYELDGFERNSSSMDTTHNPVSHGMVVYSKFAANFSSVNIYGVEVMIGETSTSFGRIQLCFLYCSPKISSFEKIKTVFRELCIYVQMSEKCCCNG